MIRTIVIVAVMVVACSAAWVFTDARARGIPARKAATWAALQGVEWPLFLWLYRRARPKGRRGSSQPQVP